MTMLRHRRPVTALGTVLASVLLVGAATTTSSADDLLPDPESLVTSVPLPTPTKTDDAVPPLEPLPSAPAPPALPGGDSGSGDSSGSGSGGSGQSGSGSSGGSRGTPSSGSTGSGSAAAKPKQPTAKPGDTPAEARLLRSIDRELPRYTDPEAPKAVVDRTVAVQRIDALIARYRSQMSRDRVAIAAAKAWLSAGSSLDDLTRREAELAAQLVELQSVGSTPLELTGVRLEQAPLRMQGEILRAELAKAKTGLPRLERRVKSTEARVAALEGTRATALDQLRAVAPTDIKGNQARLLASGRLATQIRQLSAQLVASGRSVDGTGRFARPGTGVITSPFGERFHPILKYRKMHTGLDIGRGDGLIRAADNGVVLLTARNGGYGLLTVVDHGTIGTRKIATLYAHQSRFLVKPGQRVQKGEVIGVIGSTGLSTGPHLHFEVRDSGAIVNPEPWLNIARQLH
jgi:murein DD-endopeptidase MepM/ murein hydrolase activator NlpD